MVSYGMDTAKCVSSFYMVEINYVIETWLVKGSSLHLDGRNKRNRRIEGALLSEGGDVHAYVLYFIYVMFSNLYFTSIGVEHVLEYAANMIMYYESLNEHLSDTVGYCNP